VCVFNGFSCIDFVFALSIETVGTICFYYTSEHSEMQAITSIQILACLMLTLHRQVVYLCRTCLYTRNNNNLTFLLRLKHAMQTQRRRSLHIGKTNDQHVEEC